MQLLGQIIDTVLELSSQSTAITFVCFQFFHTPLLCDKGHNQAYMILYETWPLP